MQKIILPLLIILSSSYLLTAQPHEDKIEYDKKKQDCLVMEYNFPPQAVWNGFMSRMERLGYSGKEEKGLFNKDKGFKLYKNVTFSEISSIPYDFVVNVERKSRKKDDESVFYIIVMKEGNNALASLNAEEMGKAKSFLINLIPDFEAANLEIMITDQEELVSKDEKKLKNLKDDKEELEKKIGKLQDDIKDNEKDQDKQQKGIENQRKILGELKGKRKSR